MSTPFTYDSLTVDFEIAQLLRDGLGDVPLALAGGPRVGGTEFLRGGRVQLLLLLLLLLR